MANIFQRAATSIFNGAKRISNAFFGGNKSAPKADSNVAMETKPATVVTSNDSPSISRADQIAKLKFAGAQLENLSRETLPQGVFRTSMSSVDLKNIISQDLNGATANIRGLEKDAAATAAVIKGISANLGILSEKTQVELGNLIKAKELSLKQAATPEEKSAIKDQFKADSIAVINAMPSDNQEVLRIVSNSMLHALEGSDGKGIVANTSMTMSNLGIVLGPNLNKKIPIEDTLTYATQWNELATILLETRQQDLLIEQSVERAKFSPNAMDKQGRDFYDDDFMKEELPSAEESIAGEKDELSAEFNKYIAGRTSAKLSELNPFRDGYDDLDDDERSNIQFAKEAANQAPPTSAFAALQVQVQLAEMRLRDSGYKMPEKEEDAAKGNAGNKKEEEKPSASPKTPESSSLSPNTKNAHIIG